MVGTGQRHQTSSLDSPTSAPEILGKKRLQELVKEIDPNEQLEEDVETMLLQIADDFIEQVVQRT
jgi:transcription initiation factor TFIID subunit TAF12